MAPSAIPVPTPRTPPSSQLCVLCRRPRGGSDLSSNHHQQQQQPTSTPRLRPSIPRERYSLSSLYDDDFKAYVHECSQPGQPIKEPWLIDPPQQINSKAKAAEAYWYARYRLKLRYVTPRTKSFLEKYQHKLRDYLNKPDNKKSTIVTTMTEILHSEAFLHMNPRPQDQQATQAIEELAKLRYYADYGDYVAHACTSFRKQAQEKKVAQFEVMIGKSWGQVRDILRVEEASESDWYASIRTLPEPATPMKRTIIWACHILDGVDYYNMRYCIDWYADRNEKSHSGVPFYIKNCDWESLGKQLWQDLQDVPSVFGTDDKEKMTQTLDMIRDNRLPSRAAAQLKKDKLAREEQKEENKRITLERQQAKAAEAAKKAARKVELARTAEERKKERKEKTTTDSVLGLCPKLNFDIVKHRMLEFAAQRRKDPGSRAQIVDLAEDAEPVTIFQAIKISGVNESDAKLHGIYGQLRLVDSIDRKVKEGYTHEMYDNIQDIAKAELPSFYISEMAYKMCKGQSRNDKEKTERKLRSERNAGIQWLKIMNSLWGIGIVFVFVFAKISRTALTEGFGSFQHACLAYVISELPSIQNLVQCLGDNALEDFCRNGRLSKEIEVKIRGCKAPEMTFHGSEQDESDHDDEHTEAEAPPNKTVAENEDLAVNEGALDVPAREDSPMIIDDDSENNDSYTSDGESD
ncbi:MAG: hypothetical protein Q9213_006678 [Squamulea squamosa]